MAKFSPAQGESRQRLTETKLLVAGVAVAMRLQQRFGWRWLSEDTFDEGTDQVECELSIAFTECVVQEAGEQVTFLDRRAKPLEEVVLRRALDDPVLFGDQQLQRQTDGLCVSDDPVGGVVEAEQDARRDRPGDQRILVIRADTFRIVRQKLGLDVRSDEEIAEQALDQCQSRPCQRDIESYLEGGCGQHQATDRRCVVVHPGRSQDGADALADDGDAAGGDGMGAAEVADKEIEIPDQRGKARTVATCSRRLTVTTCIPGEHRKVVESEFVDHVLQSSRMLMTPVQQHDRSLARCRSGRRPIAVEQGTAIVGRETLFLCKPHVFVLRWVPLLICVIAAVRNAIPDPVGDGRQQQQRDDRQDKGQPRAGCDAGTEQQSEQAKNEGTITLAHRSIVAAAAAGNDAQQSGHLGEVGLGR
jgi:hypothetical protein